MKRILKIAGVLIILYFALSFLTPYISFLRDRSIRNQVNYIQSRMILGEDNVLQSRYPEGKVFSNALFAMSIIEASNSLEIKNAAAMVDQCIIRLLSSHATKRFNPLLKPKYGAFYNGWTNLCLKKYINSNLFEQSLLQDSILAKHENISNEIISVVKDSFQLMDSYPDAVWAGDNLICIASLAQEHKALKIEWVRFLEHQTAHASNLMFHVNSNFEEVRGSSSALSIYLLGEINKEIAETRNAEFKKFFEKNRFGIKFVREYEHNAIAASGDIDSGPIILNFGAVATIMNVKSQASLNQSHKFTWSFLNLLGITINFNKEKYYLFKKEMMFDLFMLWSLCEYV